MIPTLTLCSLDRLRGMVDVYNYIIRVVNILTFIYLFIYRPYNKLIFLCKKVIFEFAVVVSHSLKSAISAPKYIWSAIIMYQLM